jgi:plasmid stability protein
MVAPMASITLKDLPADLHGQLKLEAEANFRSLTQEAMARLQRSFEIDAAMQTKRDQALINEAIDSGPEEPLTRAKMDRVRDRILRTRKP